MTLYNIANPTPARRVIHVRNPPGPVMLDENKNPIVDHHRTYKEIVIEAGAIKDGVDLDDSTVTRLRAMAAAIGADKELQLTQVGGTAKPAAK